MEVDRNLLRKAQLIADGANIHDVRSLSQSYISLAEAAALVKDDEDLKREFIARAQVYKKELEVLVQQAKTKSKAA
jgi:hypothetical protein